MIKLKAGYKSFIVWIALALALICSFLVFWYTDIGDTLDNGVLLAESLVKGEFFNYYEYAALNCAPTTVYSANYNVLLYAIFAIWNLPTVILHLLKDFNYMESMAALIWCKGIIVAAYAGIFFVVRRLTVKIGGTKDDGLLAAFLSISSLCVMVPALVASQYDCLALLCILAGIMFYAEGKTKRFLLMFAIAVPLKMFALFVFLPMLLIRYKNVLKILGMTAAVMLPSYLIDLPFKGNMYYSVAMESQNGDAIDLLLGSNLTIWNVKLNLFIISYIVICFFCYMSRESDVMKQARLSVYFSFAAFAAFCIFVPIRSYWIILYTPFLAILAAIKKENRTLAVIADTLAGLGGGLFFLAYHWIYNTGTIADTLFLRNYVIPEGTVKKYSHFQGLLEALELADFKYAFFTVFVGAVVFSLWYLYPEKKTAKNTSSLSIGEFCAVASRPAIMLFTVALLLYCNYATQPGAKYDASNYSETSATNLMSENAEFSRTVSFESDETLSELTVYLNTSAYRSARSFVGVRLIETDSETVIWEDAIGIPLISGKTDVDFDLDGISVNKDRSYTVELFPITPELSEGGYVYPYLDEAGEIALLFR